jgi:hypothetical protein
LRYCHYIIISTSADIRYRMLRESI